MHSRDRRAHVLLVEQLRVRHDVRHLVEEQVVVALNLAVSLLVHLLLLQVLHQVHVLGRGLVVDGGLRRLELLAVQVLAVLDPFVVEVLVHAWHAFPVRVHRVLPRGLRPRPLPHTCRRLPVRNGGGGILYSSWTSSIRFPASFVGHVRRYASAVAVAGSQAMTVKQVPSGVRMRGGVDFGKFISNVFNRSSGDGRNDHSCASGEARDAGGVCRAMPADSKPSAVETKGAMGGQGTAHAHSDWYVEFELHVRSKRPASTRRRCRWPPWVICLRIPFLLPALRRSPHPAGRRCCRLCHHRLWRRCFRLPLPSRRVPA
jgi:hypothetical protein